MFQIRFAASNASVLVTLKHHVVDLRCVLGVRLLVTAVKTALLLQNASIAKVTIHLTHVPAPDGYRKKKSKLSELQNKSHILRHERKLNHAPRRSEPPMLPLLTSKKPFAPFLPKQIFKYHSFQFFRLKSYPLWTSSGQLSLRRLLKLPRLSFHQKNLPKQTTHPLNLPYLQKDQIERNHPPIKQDIK